MNPGAPSSEPSFYGASPTEALSPEYPCEDPGSPSTATEAAEEAAAEGGDHGSGGEPLPDAASLAASLSEKYGVDILFAEKVPQAYRDYTAEQEYSPELIDAALKAVARSLKAYPPGFFLSVRDGYCSSVSLCLAGDLHLIDDLSGMENADAFTTVEDETIWVVLNIKKDIQPGLLFHELTHAVDYCLLETGRLAESEWNLLNPQSFSYYNAYVDETGTGYRVCGSREYTSLFEKDVERIYFYDVYSRTFAMEDRARLMEKLLEGRVTAPGCAPDRCFLSSHVQAKLRFYFYTLRQSFGNGRWPLKTVWEAALDEISEAAPED